MDIEKEIEAMANELYCASKESFISCRKIARILVERRGFGNVAQAVRDFAEKLKKKVEIGSFYEIGWAYLDCVLVSDIDDLIKELYPDDNV